MQILYNKEADQLLEGVPVRLVNEEWVRDAIKIIRMLDAEVQALVEENAGESL